MTLRIPQAKHITFDKHTIKQCILRLDYSDLFDISEFAKKLIPLLTKKFPIRKLEKEAFMLFPQLFDKDKEKDDIVDKKNNTILDIYSFESSDGLNVIKISNKHISFELNNYKDFKDLLADFEMVFSEFNKHFPEIALTRLGLRKINIIGSEEENALETFKNYLNTFYTSHLTNGPFDSNLDTDRHIMSTSDVNDLNIILKYTTQSGYASNKKCRRFILDIDCFTMKADANNIISRLNEINQRIFDVYYWSISDNLRKELKPINGNTK